MWGFWKVLLNVKGQITFGTYSFFLTAWNSDVMIMLQQRSWTKRYLQTETTNLEDNGSEHRSLSPYWHHEDSPKILEFLSDLLLHEREIAANLCKLFLFGFLLFYAANITISLFHRTGIISVIEFSARKDDFDHSRLASYLTAFAFYDLSTRKSRVKHSGCLE